MPGDDEREHRLLYPNMPERREAGTLENAW
jgi:hypothetical protein